MEDSVRPHMPRILSLDGEEVRDLSSLLILRKIINEIEYYNDDNIMLLSYQYFELIGETSIDELITIMLKRLHMITSLAC